MTPARRRRGDPLRVVEGAAAYEPHLGPGVQAEDRGLAVRAAEDPLAAAVVARHVDRPRLAREQLGRQAVANGSAGAASVEHPARVPRVPDVTIFHNLH